MMRLRCVEQFPGRDGEVLSARDRRLRQHTLRAIFLEGGC